MDPAYQLIVAMDTANGIGKDGTIPWKAPNDMKHFRSITTERSGVKPNVVIMGRKTWDSLPDKFKPLPDRHNIVISRNPMPAGTGYESVSSWAEAKRRVEALEPESAFVIGGKQIYDLALSDNECVQRIHLTLIPGNYNCDVHMDTALLKKFRVTKVRVPTEGFLLTWKTLDRSNE